eukprot:CAMPEP_0184700292 /NCGR_PEP_ID=MMETSP0313-20130426/11593_1 /TAXON_ID=2792 /ORGANISM="Porphyridium aerugineum, Strain SAG 1380-2" /LENGTH=74 /DNA_ID=CAMNT_0027159881 /DNA_START=218 /DNA_END=443 /DNA_ORIENTATION=+
MSCASLPVSAVQVKGLEEVSLLLISPFLGLDRLPESAEVPTVLLCLAALADGLVAAPAAAFLGSCGLLIPTTLV